MQAEQLRWFATPESPRARATDPVTSDLAAIAMRYANCDLVEAIRWTARKGRLDGNGMSQEQIAQTIERIFPGRWTPGTIVSGCARAGLVQCGFAKNSRGRTVATWTTS